MTKTTLQGPGGLRLILDSAQIFPDDPGNGTPAMVELDRHSATFWCAIDTGELDCGEHRLSFQQQNWLEEQEGAVGDFLDKHS